MTKLLPVFVASLLVISCSIDSDSDRVKGTDAKGGLTNYPLTPPGWDRPREPDSKGVVPQTSAIDALLRDLE